MDSRMYPGEIYRYFKGGLYQIVTVAEHSETGERMVIYQALYEDFRVYGMPFDMFVGKVEGEKASEAGQRYRFERVAELREKAGEGEKRGSGRTGEGTERKFERKQGEGTGREPEKTPGEEPGKDGEEEPATVSEDDGAGVSREFLAFLDAESLKERIGCLRAMKESVTQGDLDRIYVVLDMKAGEGDVKEQLDDVIRRLAMQQRYEGGRLR